MRHSRTDREQRASQATRLPAKDKGASDLRKGSEGPIPDYPMQATAANLVRIATKAFMQMHDVDYETAQRWIAGAAVPEVKSKKPAPKSRKDRS